jgi:Flp pilus assembly protein protease CpaA
MAKGALGPLGSLLLDVLFIACLIWLSITDIQKRKISNKVITLILLIGLTKMIFPFNQVCRCWFNFAGLLPGLPFLYYWQKGRLGGGDVKLLLVCGLYLGLIHTLGLLALFALFLFTCKLFCLCWSKNTCQRQALGPAISLAAATMVAVKYFV